jgi:glycopeptide antibiotics resistance protein
VIQAEFGRALFVTAVLVLLTVCLLVVAGLRRRRAHRTASMVASIAFAVVLLGVLSTTLFGTESVTEAERRLFLDPLQGAWGWDSIAWRPVVDNVTLFVPLGALAAAAWWRRSVVTVWSLCVLLSLGIETFQYLVPTGRVANTADLIANGIGAAFGIVLAVALGARAAASRSQPSTEHPDRDRSVDASSR